MQGELSRFNFDKALLARLKHSMFQADACKTGLLDRETLRQFLKGVKLPVPKELVDFLINK
jgi:hypothetical protein